MCSGKETVQELNRNAQKYCDPARVGPLGGEGNHRHTALLHAHFYLSDPEMHSISPADQP